MFPLFYSDDQIQCLMLKFQTDWPTLYYVDKRTKRQVSHAKVHNVKIKVKIK